jgi:hypothetical protein
LEDEPVRDRNDSRLGVPDGELSDDKSINIDLVSGEELNGSIGWCIALPLGADGPPALIQTSGADSSDDPNPRELLLLLLEEMVEVSSPVVDIMRSNSRDENVTNEERRLWVFSRVVGVGFVF